MDLPLRALPIVERWDCHSCGDCCKRHTVFLDREDLARLEKQNWSAHPDFQDLPVVRRAGLLGPKILNQRADGSCVFLSPQGLCRVHAEFGEPEKPWACRMYPFELIPFGNQVRVTIRRNCPSAAANNGRPVAEHFPYLKKLVDKALPKDQLVGPPPIVRGGTRSWKIAQWVVDAMQRVMTDSNRPLVRRMVHVVRIASALDVSKEARSADETLKKLLPAIVDVAEQDVGGAFANRVPPSAQASVLFRQTAAEYARFHPNVGDRPGVAERFRLLRAAWTIAKGKGDLPRIHPGLPAATFDQLEQPLGSLPAEVIRPIADFFETNAAAVRYCGSGHFGWSVVDGVRGLALAYAVAMWLFRWVSVGRTPSVADAIEVVRMIDRSHDYPMLAGARHRRRLTWLARAGELEKLIVWQAR